MALLQAIGVFPALYLLLIIPVLLAVGFCVHQLYFHPLAKYPGPFLGRITNLYAGYHAWTGDIHRDMKKCHEKYGDYVRYAPNKLLFNTAEGLKDIFSHSSNVKKSVVYNEMVHRAPNTLTIREKREHGIRRRIMSQGFSEAALRGFEPAILDKIHKLCLQLSPSEPDKRDGWSPSRNMSRWFDYLTFDIMADIVFSSSSYDAIGKPDNRPVIRAIEESNIRMGVLIQAPEIRRWKLDKILFPKSIVARNIFVKFVTKVVGGRLKLKKSTSKDVFSFLQNAKDPETGNSFGVAELGAESTTLVVAGSDTTSTSLSGVIFYLTRNADLYKTVTKEVRNKFRSPYEVRLGPELNSCVFLRACIDETLRMSPPVGASLWREVAAGGAIIDGHAIPAGCDVGLGIYSLHHSQKYYENPDKFFPERWLKKRDETAIQMPMTPFSIGPRSCIGKVLAMHELMLTIAVLIMKFEFRVAQEDWEQNDEFMLRDHLTSSKNGPMVQFKIRDGSA